MMLVHLVIVVSGGGLVLVHLSVARIAKQAANKMSFQTPPRVSASLGFCNMLFDEKNKNAER
jgi:hypothetical protein